VAVPDVVIGWRDRCYCNVLVVPAGGAVARARESQAVDLRCVEALEPVIAGVG
jgi:hypothetical protein